MRPGLAVSQGDLEDSNAAEPDISISRQVGLATVRTLRLSAASEKRGLRNPGTSLLGVRDYSSWCGKDYRLPREDPEVIGMIPEHVGGACVGVLAHGATCAS
jgi:hypothetical protein